MKVLIITGPTGTGKSDFAIKCAERLGGEIINADAGQFYAPLVIGTAMPTTTPESIPHHLFGHIKTPTQTTVPEWFEQARAEIKRCITKGRVPIVVGGSGFYISSLFYPISRDFQGGGNFAEFESSPTNALYAQLSLIDAERARDINSNDRYRIIRALQIASTGVLPSQLKPRFAPSFSPALVVHVDRSDRDLRERIALRISGMLEAGWLAEAEGLDDPWREFALRRGFIGYRQLIGLSRGIEPENDYPSEIGDETWGYVKRQRKYLRSLRRKLEATGDGSVIWREFCLTSENCEVYLNQIQLLYAS